MQNEITGVEVESVDELSEGDRITVVYDTHVEVEQTGTDYKIPETKMQEDHVRVDDALIEEISKGGFAGELMIHITECSEEQQAGAADGIPMWVDEDGVTVIKHDDDDPEQAEIGGQTVSEGDTVEQGGERWTVDDITHETKVSGTVESKITATRERDGKTVTHPTGTLESAFECGDCTVISN